MVDTVIIGAGISGIMTGLLLIEAGQKVAILEKRSIVEKTTGNTTAKITASHGPIYAELIKRFSSAAKIYAEANQQAVEMVAHTVDHYKIDCDFLREDMYLYVETEKERPTIERELQAVQQLGFSADFVETVPVPYPTKGAIKFTNQAQFHPRKYLLALAEKIHGNDSSIFEESEAKSLEPKGKQWMVKTAAGSVTANHIVFANHHPSFYDPAKLRQSLTEFYGMAFGLSIDGPLPTGMFYSREENSLSIRDQMTNQGKILVVSGDGGSGEHPKDPEADYHKLEQLARMKLPVKKIIYKWHTYDLSTPDWVPYIGQLSPDEPNVYVITGFGGWGMTNSHVAASIISDRILGRANPYQDFFDPYIRPKRYI